jgi:hypothetical protein
MIQLLPHSPGRPLFHRIGVWGARIHGGAGSRRDELRCRGIMSVDVLSVVVMSVEVEGHLVSL